MSGLYKACCIGGWDVVVFLDFACIPQKGVAEDSSIIERTPEEQAIFDECLPSMGVLYSTFPVLVLDEVPDELAATKRYADSGWCTCEFHVALVSHTLHTYSGEQLLTMARSSQVENINKGLDEATAAQLAKRAQEEVASKNFFSEDDRAVALPDLVNDS